MGNPKVNEMGPRMLRAGGLVFRGEQKIGMRVINKTGSDIAVGKLVALSSLDVTSGLNKIVLADADDPGHRDLFVTFEQIDNGDEGTVYKGGLSAANLDTNSATTAGDPVFISPTAGAFAHTAPGDVAVTTRVGYVVVKSSTVGQIRWQIAPQDHKVGQALQLRKRFTIAEVNAGATVVAAPGTGYQLRVVDCTMISIGGAVGAATTVDLLGTQAASSVKLIANAIAGLTRSALLRMGATNSTVLADGASNVACDANTALTIGKTGSTATTATHVDVLLTYAVDRA